MKVTNIALGHKTSVFVLLAIITIGGLLSYTNLPVESFPDIKQPVVYVATPYVGVAPTDLETLVLKPLEDKLEEISQVEELTSKATEGYASITAQFRANMDVEEAVRKVREKVDQARPELPADLEDPIVQEINFENVPIMIVSITGEESLVRLKKIAEDLQDMLEKIPGVLEVALTGGLEREVRVDVNPTRLKYYNLGVEDVTNAIRQENLTIPGGSTESQDLKWTVRVPGEFSSVDEIRNIVVKAKNGQPIYLYDLADVYFGFKDESSFARFNGKPSVTLTITKRSGENIIRITDDAKEILAEQSEDFPAGVRHALVMDMSKDINTMVNDLENNIISGLLLVVFVLYFFMGARNGLLVGIAIPLSMLISFVLISFLGYTLNMMVLFSLILALGMLVDNAIVIVENIYRHHEEGKSLMMAAKEATAEVGMAVVVSTITTLMAFLPLIFWDDMMGEFMKFLPITLIITLSCSLFVGLIFNPVLASNFLKINPNMDKLWGDRFLRWLTVRYERTLRWTLENRIKTLIVTLAAFFGMFATWIMLNLAVYGVELFPNIEPQQIVVDIEAPLGTRVQSVDDVTKIVETRVTGTKDMEAYVTNVGNVSDPNDFGASGSVSHKAQLTLDMMDRVDREQNAFLTMDEVAEAIKGIPGATVDVSKIQDGPPTGKPVEIEIKGREFTVLTQLADEILEIIKDVPNITKIKNSYQRGKPELRVRIDREKAAMAGLNTSMVANTIRTAVNGTEASEYRIGTDEYDITVRFDQNFRQSYNDLLNLTVFHEDVHYPLANFATVELTSGLSSINHKDGDRVVLITAESLAQNPAEVLAECKNRLEDFSTPSGYSIAFAGQNEEQEKSMAFLANAFLVAIFLIFFILVTEFNSVTLPFVILASVVLSFFGVFFGLVVTMRPFGIIMTGIGIISLAGVVVNNAIVLIDYIQKLRERGYAKMDAIVEGGKTRLRPVILTAITTILGLIPLTLGINIDFIGLLTGNTTMNRFIQFGAESSQWWSGMGIAVIFGLLFATLFTLIIVPILYHLLSNLGRRTAEIYYRVTGQSKPMSNDPDAGASPAI